MLCIIYIFNDLQSIAIIYVLGILFIFSLIFAPRSKQIRVIRFFPKIFIPCDCDQYSDRGAYIWKTVQKKYSKKHDITLGGSINDANESDLSLWIVIIAVVIAFIIILIMANGAVAFRFRFGSPYFTQ